MLCSGCVLASARPASVLCSYLVSSSRFFSSKPSSSSSSSSAHSSGAKSSDASKKTSGQTKKKYHTNGTVNRYTASDLDSTAAARASTSLPFEPAKKSVIWDLPDEADIVGEVLDPNKYMNIDGGNPRAHTPTTLAALRAASGEPITDLELLKAMRDGEQGAFVKDPSVPFDHPSRLPPIAEPQTADHLDFPLYPKMKKKCPLCDVNAPAIEFTNPDLLSNFITPGGRIKPRRWTGNCMRHQRKVSKVIKHARNAGLLHIVEQHKYDSFIDRRKAMDDEAKFFEENESQPVAARTALEYFWNKFYNEEQIQMRALSDESFTAPLDLGANPDLSVEAQNEMNSKLRGIEETLDELLNYRFSQLRASHVAEDGPQARSLAAASG